MERFEVRHIAGFLVVAACLGAFSLYTARCHGSECEVVNTEIKRENIDTSKTNPERITEQLKNGEIVLLDVREESEWNEGHIEGAKHIALSTLDVETTKDISKETPVYVYCRSGRRAQEAEIKLKGLGFNEAKSIGGIIDWQANGGSLVK